MESATTNTAVAVDINLPELDAGLGKLLGTQLTLEDERTLRALLRYWRENGSAEPLNVWREIAAHIATGGDAGNPEEWTATIHALFDKMSQVPGGEMFLVWAGGVWVRGTHVPKPMSSKDEHEMNRDVEALRAQMSNLEPELARLKQEKKALAEQKSALDSSIYKSKTLVAEMKKSIREVDGR